MNIFKRFKTNLSGCYFLKQESFLDERGAFTKIYNDDAFRDLGIDISFKEQFFTSSNKDVIRGMHFQTPPYDHEKLVTCITGRVLDVLLDLRVQSKTYSKYEAFELNSITKDSIFIPKGIAHGFLSLESDSIVLYSTSKGYYKDYDMGIHWDSFDFKWPCVKPIVSSRDNSHSIFNNFISPF